LVNKEVHSEACFVNWCYLTTSVRERGTSECCSKRILNTVEKHKSFVYSDARWSKQMPGREIEFDVQPRKNGKPICSGCGKKRPGYDCQVARRFQFVPLWAIPVFLVYAMRRVNCPQCGVVVEQVP